MKVGMPTLYEFNTIEQNVELADKLNLDFIELNLNFEYCCKALEDPIALKTLLDEHKLTLNLHFFDEFDLFAPEEVVKAYMSLFKKYVELAGQANLNLVNIHLNPGSYTTINGVKFYNFDLNYKEKYRRLEENLISIENICKKVGAILSIENTVMPRQLTKVYSALVKKGFHFTYDVGHDYSDKERVLSMTKKLPRFVEFHIHDASKKGVHLPIGSGKVFIKPFKELAFALNSYVVIEVKDSAGLVESVKKFYEI